MWIPFSNWQPDLDPVTPGVLMDGTRNIVPTRRGYRHSQALRNVAGQADLGANPTGLWYAMRNDGVNNLYAAVGTSMKVRVGYSWTNAVAAAVTVSAVATRWQFAQFGDLTFAGTKETQPMVTDTTTFTSIATMPRFAIIGVANEFVMLGNVAVSATYSDGYGATMVTPGDYPDRWWCSGIGNPFAWNPDLATQCTSGRLTDIPGPLTAGKALGDRWVFYKQRGIWLGENTTLPFVWEWAMISKEIGTWGADCVAVVGDQHFFLGNDDFYSFDGQAVKPIGQGVREWFFNQVNRNYLYKTLAFVDRNEKIVYWAYASNQSSGSSDRFICFHYENGRWGNSGDFTAHCAVEVFADNFTWDQLWAGYTWDSIPNTEWDKVAPVQNTYLPAFLKTADGALTMLYNGAPQNSTMITSFGGDDAKTSLLRRVRMRWITPAQEAYLTPYRLMLQGGNPEAGITRTQTFARFDFTQVARWHKIKLDTVASVWETTGIDAEVLMRGRE